MALLNQKRCYFKNRSVVKRKELREWQTKHRATPEGKIQRKAQYIKHRDKILARQKKTKMKR